ncbi:MAG: Sec-independent protein translocase protein TatB [Thiobacillus sp.]|nr:Sec-independent protein translocase protein TatB [Thiobacillus sp.]
MFDIGFTELLMIGVVALIVIGPERLPKVARTFGHLYGRMQRYVSDVKSDISREIDLDELKRAGQEFKQSVESSVTDIKQQTSVVDDYLREETNSLGKAVSSVADDDEMPPLSEPQVTPRKVEVSPQQSLSLEEPDQNKPSAPVAIIETADSDPAGKSA